MTHTIKVNKASVWPIVKKVFPDYRGRTFKVFYTDSVTFYDTNWGGGTRNQYAAVRLGDGLSRVFDNMPAPWVNPVEGQTFQMLPDVAVVEHTIFCGHDLGITVYLHPHKQLVAS